MKKNIIFVCSGIIVITMFFISLYFIPPFSLFTAWYASQKQDYKLLQNAIGKLSSSQSQEYKVDIAYYKIFLQYLLYNKGIIKENAINVTELEKLQAILHVSKHQNKKNRILLSRMYLLKGEYQNAMKEYWILLKMDPNNDVVRYNYEILLLSQFLAKKKNISKEKKTLVDSSSAKDTEVPQSLFKIAPYRVHILLEKEKRKNSIPNY